MGAKKLSGRITLFIAIICGLLVMLVLTFGFYYYTVKDKVSKQLYMELERISDLNNMLLEAAITDRKQNLESLALFCDEADGSGNENWRDAVRVYETEYFRLGVADLDGNIYYGVGKRADISGRAYYDQVIEKKETVVGMEEAAFDGNNSIIIATPFYSGGDTIKGVLCAEYAADELGRILNRIEGQRGSFTAVLDKRGGLITNFGDLNSDKTIYDELGKVNFDSEQVSEKFWSAVENGHKAFFEGYGAEGDRVLFYCRPAEIKDWSIITIIKTKYYQQIIGEIQTASLVMAAVEAILVACLFLSLMAVLKSGRKEIELRERDFLTNVYTREAAKKILERELGKRGENRFGCCFFLDIDDFKQINDTLGHDGGDRTLVECAMILKQETRTHDVVSRFGGDEFCIWLWDITDRELAGCIAGRILNAFHSKMDVHVSVGITFFAEKGDTYNSIVKRADSGLYMAKELGKDRFAFVEESGHEE